jgi:hypothetical protein
MIRLGQTQDGRLVLASNEPLPADIRYIEYDIGQRRLNLVFDTEDEETTPMPLPVCERTAPLVHASANLIVIPLAGLKPDKPYGYVVPLIQIGV